MDQQREELKNKIREKFRAKRIWDDRGTQDFKSLQDFYSRPEAIIEWIIEAVDEFIGDSQHEDGGFRVGDHVRLIAPDQDNNPDLEVGDEGVIVGLSPNTHLSWPGVDWGKQIRNGHTCDDNCNRGQGWYVKHDRLEKVEPE